MFAARPTQSVSQSETRGDWGSDVFEIVDIRGATPSRLTGLPPTPLWGFKPDLYGSGNAEGDSPGESRPLLSYRRIKRRKINKAQTHYRHLVGKL